MPQSEEWTRELRDRRARFWTIITQAGCDVGLVYGSREHPEPFRYVTWFLPVLGDQWGILHDADGMVCVLNFHWQLEEAR
jgi:hypothetical protein